MVAAHPGNGCPIPPWNRDKRMYSLHLYNYKYYHFVLYKYFPYFCNNKMEESEYTKMTIILKQ